MEQLIGPPLDRVDGRLKVTGRAVYSAEHLVPGVTHAILITSTIPKGRVSAMDRSEAETSPGVLAVLTPMNAPKLPPPNESGGKGPTSRRLQVLQDDLVYYSNQPIGVVVAETLEQAQYASELVRITYEPDHFNVSLEKALGQAYKPEKVGGAGDKPDSDRGNFPSGWASSSKKTEQIYITPIETHNPMEPHATIAVWEGPRLTLYDATQGVFTDRKRVAELLGMQTEDVRVVSPFLGGGFGSKGPVWSHVILAALAARRVNRPVKLVVKREQMFGPLGFRGRTRQTVAAGAKNDGTLVALRHDTVTQTSSFDEFIETASLTARMLYNSPNNSTAHRGVRLDMGTPSFMRAPGEAPGNFALESAMDELAYELDMDPLELRIRNYAEQDPEKNKPWSSKSLRECYRAGAERFGWSNRNPKVRATRQGNKLVGWGMATAVYPTRRSKSSAIATLRADGTALVEAGTQDLGTGTYTIMTQIAADTLGVSPAQVTFRLGDTRFPETPVSGGSQTAASTGSAVLAASQALREKLIQLASSDPQSPLYNSGAGDLTIADGWLTLKSNPTRREQLSAFMKRQPQGQIEAHGQAEPGSEKDAYSMYAFGAQFAEVQVDADLGQLRVTRMVGTFAAGRILNQKTARSQFMGGMVWGIGMALLEDTIVDHPRGRIVNANLAEYHVPVNLDVPSIDVIMVPEVDTHVNPAGVKGVGEIGITGSTAAIVNAVYHATGRRVRELPVTLDKLI